MKTKIKNTHKHNKTVKTSSLLDSSNTLILDLQSLMNKVDTCNHYYDRAINKADPERAADIRIEHGSVMRNIANIMNELDKLMSNEGNRYID